MMTSMAGGADVSQPQPAALQYAAAGWPVFPCQVGTKVPATQHGVKDATTDPARIRAWWGAQSYNLAIATGAPGPDVLDVDVKDGGAAWAAYNRLKQAGLLAGASALVRTRSGGLHLYFAGTGQGNAAHIGGVPLDFRGTGGYVLAPPSEVDGGRYQIIEHRSATGTFSLDAARRLLEPPRPPRPRTPPATGDVGKLAVWVENLEQGNRNAGLYWAACRAAEAGHAGELDALAEAALRAGLPEDEARRTIASAERRAAS
jgi:Bifunctional DNA primase/polymerase, N-terminal